MGEAAMGFDVCPLCGTKLASSRRNKPGFVFPRVRFQHDQQGIEKLIALISLKASQFGISVLTGTKGSANQGFANQRSQIGIRKSEEEKSPMKLRIGGVVVGFLWVALSLTAQTASSASAASQVPPLIPFASVASDEGGSSLSGVVNITFSLYTAQQGGAPLWTETQHNIPLDATGHYSVELGISKPNGVPTTLFTTGEARWLGVRIAEQAEQPRVLLLSVPYALKAGDAATIGGLPPSAFVLAAPLTGAASAPGAEPTTGQEAPPPSGDVTGSGTVNYLPLWNSTSDIISSVLVQQGSGSTAKIGINTATPTTTLDVKGAGTIRGALSLPTTGSATATAGKNSQPLSLAASAFNSTSSTALNQTFQWQAEPARNDTSTPSGTLNLLFGEGVTKPSETGLHFANNGQITFASGQTFPGAGTITGITTATGSGLSGGGTSGTLNLGLLHTCATSQVLQWNGSSWVCAAVGTGTVTSVATGLGLKGGPIKTGGTLSIDTTVVPQLSAVNTFTGNQTVNGTLNANGTALGMQATTTSANGVGVNALSSAATGTGAGVIGATNSPTGYGVEGQNNATTGNAVAVFGTTQSATGYGVKGQSAGTGVYGLGLFGVQGVTSSTLGSAGVLGAANATTGIAAGVLGDTLSPAGAAVEGFVQAASGGTAGLFQVNTASATILQGNNGGTTEFKVDSAGNMTAGGVVSGSGFQIGSALFDYGSVASENAFLGFAGNTAMTGFGNTASGTQALLSNTTGTQNTASGIQSLQINCSPSASCTSGQGSYNTADGTYALGTNATGSFNTGVGFFSGVPHDGGNGTGSNNTALGAYARPGTATLTNATAIGANAEVDESNALVLGGITGLNGGTSVNVGIGTAVPGHLLDVAGAVAFDSTGLNNGTNFIDLTFGINAGEGISSSRTAGPNQYGIDLWTDFNRRISIEQHGNVGIGTASPSNLLTLVQGGGAALADGWNTYSSRRWKTNIQPLQNALGKVEQLRGVSYDLKGSGKHEIGVIAEEVGAVLPEVVTYEDNGKDARGVDYSRLTALLIEATKQQQREFRQQGAELAKALFQIKQQQNLLRSQSAAMRSLKAEVRETRENLRTVKAQIAAAQPALVAAK